MDTSLRQLAAYVAVAQAGGFTAAAARLRVSQSTLSRAVSDLERVLGVRLLERDTRNVQLTAAGRETLRVAEQIVDAHRSGMKQLRRYLLGESGVVAMATLPSVAAVLLPRLISAFRGRRPGVSVRIMDGLERAVLGKVLNGDADFAVTTVGAASDRLEHRPLIRDRFRAVLPESHPLADRDEVTWEDLAAQPFLAVGPESSVRRLTDAAFEQAGAVVAPAAEAGNVATVGGLVAAGLGVSAMPALVLPLLGPGHVVHRTLVGPAVERRLDIVVRARRTLPPAAAAFLDLLDEARTEGREVPEGAAWITH
ncbi:LysR family transcriptional regulator YbhD [[Actinomadura] parvosata subsp. kistnae]|uniref:LysR family transcriptional regulator n=1 Tax=[Actinomadura] parvosata subsp. kistnae TaxID=1909395 RepID=A0A1V0A0C3_9ACTN|nr:LysR family transcriptional regulator [Nonomuraea sp. ATCC 55076]AQZ63643.1 LysR family transcriptional regulator [Nonomuraea sp. ATCC 55076]SPL99434.1 LysR family transcriptional regulator YbhD [Actinomadura parvosata subsp. kistnae]